MTFERTWLTGGFNQIIVVLGLFALSQAFLPLTDEDSVPEPQPVEGSLFEGMKKLRLYKRVAAVAGSFGVLMGMIPSVGKFTAQFLS